MIQEYLIQDLSEKDAIDEYKPKEIHKRMYSADNGNCWFVQFSIDSNNEKNAIRLSEVDDYVRSHFHVTVLTNGCSSYFHKRLYPYVSGFECKLRKLLYLASAINHDESTAARISNLESQDLGQIFSLLFIDNTFMGKVKDGIKSRNRETFTKKNIIASIDSIQESILWDVLLNETSVPTLRERFNDVRDYRNDVMHSHHSSWGRFKEGLSLFKTINSELDKAIHEIEITESKASSKLLFNQVLADALKAQEQYSQLFIQMSSNLELFEAAKSAMEDYYRIIPNYDEVVAEINQMAKSLQTSPEMLKAAEEAKRLSELYRFYSALIDTQYSELFKAFASFISMQEHDHEETSKTQDMTEQDTDNGEEDRENGGPGNGKNEI